LGGGVDEVPAMPSHILTFAIQFFCHPHTPQILFIWGRKEFAALLVIKFSYSFKTHGLPRNKEYNLRYLLAKVRTT
jgi:hypothetical protein